MMRFLHRWPGLLAMLLVMMLAVSGAALSVFPAADRLAAVPVEQGLSVADLTRRIQAVHPGVEQIKRAPSGRISAYWFDGDVAGAAVVDPATGRDIASADPSPVQRWLTNFHRALFLDDGGRIVMALGALAMLVLSISGILLVTRRVGGWRRWFTPLRGPLSGALHVEIARIAVLGLLLSSTTALWMTASTFGFVPDQPAALVVPADVSGRTGIPVGSIEALRRTAVADLRELSLPAPDDPTDVFTLKTDQGSGMIDQGTGELLVWEKLGFWQRVSETVYMLHTGQGAATLGLILGFLALGVPVMAGTGFVMWFGAWRRRPRISHNAAVAKARTILLVGSEGGTTWGFAAELHKALRQAGQTVHAAPLSSFDPFRYEHAERIIVLAATYGDGDEPASAKGFLEKLAGLAHVPAAPLAVLAFGDSSFPDFCGYAAKVASLAEYKGWRQFLGLATVDRQSATDFARWGRDLGEAMGVRLDLVHHPVLPATSALTLLSRRDHGAEVQAPVSILRFALPRASLWQRITGRAFGRFRPGDLVGIMPKGASVPRFYSLASGTTDGFLEIVVRRQPDGLCSGQLTSLEPGETMDAFIRANPSFRTGKGSSPLILIGAGSGIGPLAGFVRSNEAARPIHLFFGMRHPSSDFLYDEELAQWAGEGRLTRLVTAASRGSKPHYVQDALRHEAAEVLDLIARGARIMVCGGREMAAGVADALTAVLAPAGLTPELLKAEGRYVEDVY